MSTITVLITSFNDRRISSTLNSLIKQNRKPEEIFVADGGTKWDIEQVCKEYGARFELLPGNVVETRNQALNLIKSDIIAYIDTDEIASESWLDNLVKPIEESRADFTGGPAKHTNPKSGPERYVNEVEDYVYNYLVPQSIVYLPMGNSAWKREIFKKVGGFDLSIAGGAEDYDINLKATKTGYRGLFVKDAYVYHDHSEFDSYWKLTRKRYSYLRATAKTYIKNNALSYGVRSSRGGKIDHPFYLVETLLKPIALADAFLRN